MNKSLRTTIFFFSFFFSLFVQAQGCPNGICPPNGYDVTGRGETIDKALKQLEESCLEKETKEVSPNRERFIKIQNIRILWNNQEGQYVEGRCLVFYKPVQ